MSRDPAGMVRAARCITRFRTTVVGVGCPGRIVEVAGRDPDLTYTGVPPGEVGWGISHRVGTDGLRR